MVDWILIALAVTAGLAALLVAVTFLLLLFGQLLPRHHVARSRARIGASPEEIWETITDHEDAPCWREGLRSVERAPDRDGRAVWIETWPHGPMTYEVVEARPPRRYVLRLADEKLPFSGTWTIEIWPVEGGSTVTITKEGRESPLLRPFARFAIGYHRYIDRYLRDLGRELAEDVEPSHVPR